MYSYPERHKMPLLLIVAGRETALLLLGPITEGVAMGRSVVVVRKLLWAMRRRTVVVLMATVGVVLLVGGMALANTPPPDPDSDAPLPKYLALAYSRSLHEARIDKQYHHLSFDGRADTLQQAKWRAYNECVKSGGRHSAVYKDDCRGIAWVRDGWLAFAVEDLASEGPSGYKPKWGWGINEVSNKAKGKAVQECYEADPYNRQCKLNYNEWAGSISPSTSFNGGPWHNP
jgi:hypothetical protein